MEEKQDLFKVGGKGTAKGVLKLLMARKPVPPGAYTQEEFDKIIAEEEE